MVQHGARVAQGKEQSVYIANQEDFAAFAERAARSSVLAIDTEFSAREGPIMQSCALIQLATDDETAIVDPFAVDDLGILAPLAPERERRETIPRRPVRISRFYCARWAFCRSPSLTRRRRRRLLGHTQQIGYAALVHAECGVTAQENRLVYRLVASAALRFTARLRRRRRRVSAAHVRAHARRTRAQGPARMVGARLRGYERPGEIRSRRARPLSTPQARLAAVSPSALGCA